MLVAVETRRTAVAAAEGASADVACEDTMGQTFVDRMDSPVDWAPDSPLVAAAAADRPLLVGQRVSAGIGWSARSERESGRWVRSCESSDSTDAGGTRLVGC